MKTPMQELIEQLKEERDGFMSLPPHSNIQERTANCFGSCIEIAERMLKKEKEVMCQFQSDGQRTDFFVKYEDNDDCFEQTFNTKEK
jgi:hypothetical protein